MKQFFALYRKELHHYIYSLLSYLFIIVFLVGLGWLYWRNVFLLGQTSMREWFALLPWFYLFLLPALSMRLWSEEKKLGTLEKLLTFPISDVQAVLAKFTAAMSFLGVVLALSLPIPFTLNQLGDLDIGPVIGSYLGAWLLGGAYLALGQWISSFTKNQIVAFLITITIGFILLVIGLPAVTLGSGVVGTIFHAVSTHTHFISLAKGVIDVRDIVYYGSVIGLFLYFNMLTLSQRKQRVYSVAQVGLLVAIVIVGNALLAIVSWKVDLTEGKQFTLSTASKSIVQELEDPLTVKVFFSKDLPQDLLALRQDVYDLVNEYTRSGNVNIEYIDPVDSLDAQGEAQSYGIPELQFNVLEGDKFEVTTGYTGIALLYRDQIEVLPVVQGTQSLEYDMTAAVYKMSREELPAIGIVTEYGSATVNGLVQFLEQQYTVTNVAVTDVDIDTMDSVIIVDPAGEIPEEDVYAIDQYMMEGGNVLVLMNGITVDLATQQPTPNSNVINDWLAHHGVVISSNFVADYGSSETLSFGRGILPILKEYPYWPVIIPENFNPDHPITQDLQTAIFPWTSSLRINYADGVTRTDLIYTTLQSVGVSLPTSIEPESVPEPKEDEFQPQLLSVLLEGNFTSYYAGKDKPEGVDVSAFVNATEDGHLLVVGNGNFIVDEVLEQNPSNALFMLNAVDVLTQDESLLTIRSRTALDRPLEQLEDDRKGLIRYVNLGASIILVLILAGVAFAMRKFRSAKVQSKYGKV